MVRKAIKWFSGSAGIAIALLVLANVCLVAYLFSGDSDALYAEAMEIPKDASFKDLSSYFSSLAEDKGALYAFEVLKRAPLPPNIDVHLLGHIVGDILYEQQGAEGILSCTDDFRNACSHTIVIGTLLEKGPESFGEIVELCKQAPGGPGAYTMCFHGLGHGVLAYNEYELPLAVKMCEKSGTKGREYSECVGGTIMEMIGGVHDREMWLEKSKKYFKAEDPLYPCSADFMNEAARGMCYTYITPHLFVSAGGNLGNPLPADFKEAFTYCEPLTNGDRRACFGGFGKEFVVLAQNRDIRAIDRMSDEQLRRVYEWCSLAKPEDGKIDCMGSALSSIFWGGENDPKASLRFCELSPSDLQSSCYDVLFGNASSYLSSEGRKAICAAVPEEYSQSCQRKLLQ
ncbi:MAG: hypothetical protein HZA81_03510 [Candidatus Taylorbacteria bacterium]|nr:hypothetical protein [Candidatus Taylorbacteria bacterium]